MVHKGLTLIDKSFAITVILKLKVYLTLWKKIFVLVISPLLIDIFYVHVISCSGYHIILLCNIKYHIIPMCNIKYQIILLCNIKGKIKS